MSTPFGPPSGEIRVGRVGGAEVAFLARHGPAHSVPPHRLNHRANLWALQDLGVRRVVGTSSVGALKTGIRPGTIVVPDDYLCLWDLPTFYDDKVVHVTPGLDAGMRKAIARAAKREGAVVRERGVYAQTRGPRLETKAEIRLLADYADVVGMTMASEATLAAELQIPYASLCTVDNYAHGVSEQPLTYEAIMRTQKKNAALVTRLLGPVIRALLRGA